MVDRLMREYEGELGQHINGLVGSLSALHALSEIESRSSEETALLRDALRALMQYREMERCSFFMLSDGRLVNVTGLCLDDLDEKKSPLSGEAFGNGATQIFEIGEGIIGHAAASRSIQYCRNCRTDPRFQVRATPATDFAPGSVISAPVENGEELLGVLNISHPREDFFTEIHIRLLRIFCNVLGQLIMNCRLNQGLEREIADRTRQLGEALEEARVVKDRFEALSFTDDLTGLFNRRYFFSQAEKMVSAAYRYGYPLCTLALDLDHFKSINDTYGHAMGDRVLADLAVLLKKEVRESDLLARLGGEEFVVLAPNTDSENGLAIAERFRTGVESMRWGNEGEDLRVSVSIGLWCLCPASNPVRIRIDDLMRLADQALYEAKRGGRNRVAISSGPGPQST